MLFYTRTDHAVNVILYPKLKPFSLIHSFVPVHLSSILIIITADIQVETEEMVDWSKVKAESCAPGEKDRKSCVSSA